MRLSPSVGLPVALLVAVPLAAQTVDEVIAKHLEARGGIEKIRAVQSMRLTGTMTLAPGMAAPFKIEMKRPGLMRVEFIFQGSTGIQATDGKRAWASMPFSGRKEPVVLPEEESKSLLDQADLDGPLVDWQAKGHKVELVGKEKRGEGEAFKLKLTLKGGDLRYLFIDAVSFLDLGGEGLRSTPRGQVDFESRFSDHRRVEGLMVPFLIEAGPKEGEERQRLAFDKVELNVPLDDGLFAVPEAATPLGRPN